jgi:diacylglycerol kinase family enzyme
MRKSPLLLINEASGAASKLGADAIAALVRKGLGARGQSLDVTAGDAPMLIEAARRARRERSLVITAGGDGTQAAVAGALAGSRCALLPLPFGTMNLFCRDLGMPLDPEEAAEMGLAGRLIAVDIGKVGDRAFLNNVVFGVYSDLAEAREELRAAQSIAEVGSAIAAGASALIDAGPKSYRVRLNRRTIDIETNALAISNNAVTGAIALVPSRARLDEGRLSVYLAQTVGAGDFAMMVAAFAAGDPERAKSVRRESCTRCVVSVGERDVVASIDGDPIEMRSPVYLSVRRSALRVLRPLPEAA